MSEKTRIIEMEVDDNLIDETFKEGLTCCAEIEVGEAVDCILTMFRNLQGTELLQGFKQELGPGHDQSVDKFIMLLAVSLVSTITGNFQGREKEAEAKA